MRITCISLDVHNTTHYISCSFTLLNSNVRAHYVHFSHNITTQDASCLFTQLKQQHTICITCVITLRCQFSFTVLIHTTITHTATATHSQCQCTLDKHFSCSSRHNLCSFHSHQGSTIHSFSHQVCSFFVSPPALITHTFQTCHAQQTPLCRSNLHETQRHFKAFAIVATALGPSHVFPQRRDISLSLLTTALNSTQHTTASFRRSPLDHCSSSLHATCQSLTLSCHTSRTYPDFRHEPSYCTSSFRHTAQHPTTQHTQTFVASHSPQNNMRVY